MSFNVIFEHEIEIKWFCLLERLIKLNLDLDEYNEESYQKLLNYMEQRFQDYLI